MLPAGCLHTNISVELGVFEYCRTLNYRRREVRLLDIKFSLRRAFMSLA